MNVSAVWQTRCQFCIQAVTPTIADTPYHTRALSATSFVYTQAIQETDIMPLIQFCGANYGTVFCRKHQGLAQQYKIRHGRKRGREFRYLFWNNSYFLLLYISLYTLILWTCKHPSYIIPEVYTIQWRIKILHCNIYFGVQYFVSKRKKSTAVRFELTRVTPIDF